MALVEAEALREVLTRQGASASALDAAEDAAETASTFIAAYCTRLRIGDAVPPVVARVALAFAVCAARNPEEIRSVSSEGPSVSLAPVELTYLESIVLNPYRTRSA